MALSAGVNGIYLLRANLYVALQINPLTACLTGECGEVMKLFNRCGWLAEPEGDASLPHLFTLIARQGEPGRDV